MATNTAASFTNHTGNGTAGPFSISFSYLSEAEVDVTVGGVLKTLTTHYTFTSATQITFTSGNEPGNGVAIKFQRDTDISAKKVDFADGSVLTETDLDTQNDQVLFAQQEILDKLSGIEENATADQTDAEIRTAVENATDSNVFTDADHSKLNAIEASATADQTASEIRTLVESASDSNVFTDADHTKLNAIEDNATADQTAAEIRTLVESATDSNVFTDADHTKLNNIEASATADQTGAEIKSLYEGESDTNAFTDSEKTKLSGIETSADVTDATNVDAAGAVMNSDLDGKGELLVGDGSGDPTAISVGTNNFVLVADSNEPTGVKWATVPAGSGLSNVVEDTTPQLGGNLDVNGNDIVSVSNGNIKLSPNGTGDVQITSDLIVDTTTFVVDSTNNKVGIGTNTPGELLQIFDASGNPTIHVRANNQNTASLKLENDDGDWSISTGTSSYPLNFAVGGSNKLTILNDGKVGIGDTTPSTALEVNGTITGTTFSGSGASLTNLPAANLTGTLPAIDGSNLTGISAGITMFDQYRLTTSFTGAVSPISSNIERVDTNSPAFIGSAMSVSSGTFTFPSTGMYEVSFYLKGRINGDSRFHLANIDVTTDGTNFTEAAQGCNNYYDGGAITVSSCVVRIFFDVTDTSTHKVRFSVSVNSSSTQTDGDTAKNQTYFTFKKIGTT